MRTTRCGLSCFEAETSFHLAFAPVLNCRTFGVKRFTRTLASMLR